MNYEAIIFDCDGTLVDSERLGNQVLVDCAAELGVPLTLDEALAQFMGGRMADAVAYIESRLGRRLPADFTERARQRMESVFRAELQVVAGAETVLRELAIPYCVASSGPRDKIELSLGLTGLLGYFEGRIFSAYEIGRWKPEPDLFLHAAAVLGVSPDRCAVVEDSVLGVRAGVAAGMTVFGYAAMANAEALAASGAQTFDRMDLLPSLLCGEGRAAPIHLDCREAEPC
ncbi:MAG: HAD family hydrolase [Methylococcaceae bacterium]|nr:HAD family hydrolase [Methylococcaceae bacterium]